MNTVIPLLCATAETLFPLDRAMYKYPKTDLVQYAFGFAAIKTDAGEYILVDVGVYSDEEFKSADSPIFKRLTGMTNNKPFLHVLKENGINPLSVKKVILTHLHWDHAWNVDKLPNATVYVQKLELEAAVTPLPYERIHFGYWDGAYRVPPFARALHQFKAVNGDAEIAPGVRVMLAPGHTRGDQIVLVDTADGKVALLGDFANLPQGVTEDEGYPPGLLVDAASWFEAFERLKLEKADFLLSFHDSNIYSRVYG